jgi:hypothetical protein
MLATVQSTVRSASFAEAEWNRVLDGFSDANFYQTYAYGAVSWGDTSLSHLVLGQDGQPAAAAQLRIVRLPFLPAGVAYLRWGPCCRPKSNAPAWDPERFRRMLLALDAEYADRRRLLLRILPPAFAEDAEAESMLEILRECSFQRDPEARVYRTLRVDLTAEPELIRKRLDGKWRNQLNAAQRNGLTVAEGPELYPQFLALYHEMMARKQFDTTVNADEFSRIQQRLPEAQKMIVLIATRDNRPVAGLVATAIGHTAIYLLGATSNDGMKSKGSYLLQWHMMNRLKELGCHSYDLGGINPEDNPGVYHFKQGMGGHECRQLGRFSRSRSRLSSAAVLTGERLRLALNRRRGRKTV